MKKSIIILLALTLSASVVVASSPMRQTGVKELRKQKKQASIQESLTLLQSGRFKIMESLSHEYRVLVGTNKMMATYLDILDPQFKVVVSDLDSSKNRYTIAYFDSESGGGRPNVKIVYDTKTGYLRLDYYSAQKQMSADEFSSRNGANSTAGNYADIAPL